MPFSAFAESGADEGALKADYNELQKKYETLLRDRDNLKAQTTFLLKYKKEILKAQQEVERINNERAQWELERQTLKSMYKKAQNNIELLKVQGEDLKFIQFQLEEENDQIKKSLSKTKAGYIIVDDLKRKIKELRKEKSRSNKANQKLKKKIGKLEDQSVRAETTEEVLRQHIAELKDKYKNSLRQNNILVKKLQQQPREYAEIARENRILIKRTALMHYNLGVFYSQRKEYPRAVAEFEKAIELDPEDANAYFNLGYIYAECYVDRPKAIENFKKYLRLVKKGDKDVDWVKKYILTWQTWEGKSVAK